MGAAREGESLKRAVPGPGGVTVCGSIALTHPGRRWGQTKPTAVAAEPEPAGEPAAAAAAGAGAESMEETKLECVL